MAASHIESHAPLPSWFDDELKRLAARKSLNLDLFRPSDNVSTHDGDSSQKSNALEEYLTGYRLYALTFGYASLPCTRFPASLLKLAQLVPEFTSFGYRVDSSQHRTYLNHG